MKELTSLQINFKIKIPNDSLQLAQLSLDLNKSHRLIQNAHRLDNISLRIWNTRHLHSNPSLPFAHLLSNNSRDPFSSQLPIHVQSIHPTASSSPPTQLKAPPQIFSTAPTPPIASSPNSTPSTHVIHPIQSLDLQPQHHLLSPHPNSISDQIPSSDCSSNHPSSIGFHSSHPNIIPNSNPVIEPRYGSDSTPSSSIGLKSFATSLSIGARDDSSTRLQSTLQDKKPNRHSTSSVSIHPSYRRATSIAGFKHKPPPPSYARLLSQTASRSVSPRLVQPTRETQDSLWLDDLTCHPLTSSSPPSCSSLSSNPHLSPQTSKLLPPSFSDRLPPQQALSSLDPVISTTSGQSYNHSVKSIESHPRIVPNNAYHSAESLPSLVSPIIPVTPNNSRVSAPFQTSDTMIPHSLASSHATGVSSSFLPSAPPPTPAQNGAHLPTTMSAALIKPKPPQRIPLTSHLPPNSTTAAAAGKKKAKFFIKEPEVDDDRFLSPPLVPIQSSNARPSHIPSDTNVQTPQLTPVASTIERGPLSQDQTDQPQPALARDVEELDGTDSDEWGSEYSDDDVDEDQNVTAEADKSHDISKKHEEEYYRQLFAKKHFDQRNQSHDGSDQPPPIRRAGLSMLFHPELNHLQHHPRSQLATSAALVRNQSALELRRQGSSSSSARRPGDQGSPNLPTTRGPRLSLGLLPRPSSLIKSKSSVAVPVLAGHEPPAMVQRSPSSHDAQSSAPRQSQRAPPGGSSGDSITNHNGHVARQLLSTQALPPLSHQQQQHPSNHRRHPSRLGGKPENVEYSDDDSDSDQEGEVIGTCKKQGMIQMTEEQAKRLGRLVKKTRNSPMLPPPTSSSSSSPPPPPPPPSSQSKIVETEPGRLNMTQTCRPQPIAAPLSPRATRKNFLSNELTESLRRNLIWERQMRAQAFGIMQNGNNDLVNENNDMNGGIDHLVNNGLIDPLDRNNRNPSNSNLNLNINRKSSSSNNVNKEYRNFSKGFHRTGW